MKTITDKHTPGPWKVNSELSAVICYGDGYKLATAYAGDLPPTDDHERFEQRNANARLIAAAPELLAALENIIETAPIDIECEDSVEKYRSFVLRVACKAVAALQGGAK